jgi:hypothetical protein
MAGPAVAPCPQSQQLLDPARPTPATSPSTAGSTVSRRACLRIRVPAREPLRRLSSRDARVLIRWLIGWGWWSCRIRRRGGRGRIVQDGRRASQSQSRLFPAASASLFLSRKFPRLVQRVLNRVPFSEPPYPFPQNTPPNSAYPPRRIHPPANPPVGLASLQVRKRGRSRTLSPTR